MFQVTHEMTHYTWHVNTKDELLYEIEILHQKQLKFGTQDTLHIQHIHTDGDVKERLTVFVPLEKDVAILFHDFGNNEDKKNNSKHFLSRLFNKQKSANKLQNKTILSTKLDPLLENSNDTNNVLLANHHLQNMTAKTKHSTQIIDNPLQSSIEIEQHLELTEFEQIVETNNRLLESLSNSQLSYTENISDQSIKNQDVINDNISIESMKNNINDKQLRTPHTFINKTLEDLSTNDLQTEFIDRIKTEMFQLDHLMHILQTKKDKYTQLLTTIETNIID